MLKGHAVQVLDFNNNPRDLEKRLKDASSLDVIGVSVKSFTYQSTPQIQRVIKRKDLISGGPHITLDGFNFLKENDGFEVAVVGEGEETIVEFIDAKEKGSNFDGIKGIIYRDDGEIIVNPQREFISDLDLLPYPNYEVFDTYVGRLPKYPIITSRGCPYPCIFCSVGRVSGKKWRFRRPKEVVKELEAAKEKYGSISFDVLDDNFTLDIERAKKICELLIERKVDMSWSCPNGIRADRLNEELVALMKESGCRSVSLGVESGVENVFYNAKKVEKLEDIERAVKILKKHRIRVVGYFIIGLPGDNMENVERSIEFAKKIGLDESDWNLLVPYPGTDIWQWVNTNATVLRDWRKGFHFGLSVLPVFETEDFTERERMVAYEAANIKCRNYLAFFDENKSFLSNAVTVLSKILSYDAKGLPRHLLWALKDIRRIIVRLSRIESPRMLSRGLKWISRFSLE